MGRGLGTRGEENSHKEKGKKEGKLKKREKEKSSNTKYKA